MPDSRSVDGSRDEGTAERVGREALRVLAHPGHRALEELVVAREGCVTGSRVQLQRDVDPQAEASQARQCHLGQLTRHEEFESVRV